MKNAPELFEALVDKLYGSLPMKRASDAIERLDDVVRERTVELSEARDKAFKAYCVANHLYIDHRWEIWIIARDEILAEEGLG